MRALREVILGPYVEHTYGAWVDPALRLWRRPGFAVAGETGTRWLMERASERDAPADTKPVVSIRLHCHSGREPLGAGAGGQRCSQQPTAGAASSNLVMQLEPILRAHAYMKVERPPELWEADTDESRFLPLLGEIIAAALAGGTPLGELTLNASNIVVEPSEDGEDPVAPRPAEYVAITVRGATNFGPDDTWHPSAPHRPGLLFRLHHRLEAAGARFAYIRRIPPEGSFTVFMSRLALPAQA